MSPPSSQGSADSAKSSPTLERSSYPFPSAAVSAARRRSLGNRYQPRRTSATSTSSYIGGTLDIPVCGNEGTVTETGQNAISKLLQPPIVRTGLLPHGPGSAGKPPSARDIPPVTLTNIPHIDPTVFRDYLSSAGASYDAFQRISAAGEDSGAARFLARGKESKEDARLERRLSRGSISSVSPPISARPGPAGLLSPEEPSAPGSSDVRGRASGATGRRNLHVPAPLSTIPSVYFEENFHLENPRTFDIVSERSEVVRPPQRSETKGENGHAPTGRKALATNAILQEKLSWYMDTVEVHLISAISSASTSFFAALGSLKELQSEAAELIAKIRQLRQDLANLDEDMAQGGLKVIGMKRKRQNLRRLDQATAQLQRVVEGLQKCEELADKGELDQALESIDSLNRLIAGEEDEIETRTDQRQTRPNLTDLRGLNCLKGISAGVDQLSHRIGKGYEGRFVEALLVDLRLHVQRVPPQDTLQRWSNASSRTRGEHKRAPSASPAYLNTNEDLRLRLFADLKGLSKSNHTSPATAAFRDAVMREVKSIIRQHLPSSTDDDVESTTSMSTNKGRQLSQQEKSSALARNLRALDAEAAEELLVKMYTGVSEALRRLGVQVKVLLDVTSGVGQPSKLGSGGKSLGSGPNSNTEPIQVGPQKSFDSSRLQEELTHSLDLSSLLGQAVDVAQAQITKVLKVRSEQTIHLSLERFLRYFTLNRLFADECEAVSGRSGVALKNLVNQHIKDFVQVISEAERQNVADALESDKWDAQDFSEANDAMLSRVLESMVADPAPWTAGSRIWEPLDRQREQDQNARVETNGIASAKKDVRPAIVDEQKYILVPSTIQLLSSTATLQQLIVGIPSMISETMLSLIDILKFFNSRSCQLILGAGATRSAGLKNITTKHLALASQSLSLVITLVPYLREFLRRKGGASISAKLQELDKVKRLYQDHQSGIHDKLIEIMTGRALTHAAAMKKIDWDGTDNGQPSLYMETLTKETTTLHRVLSKHLPEGIVASIVRPVFGAYRELWENAFKGATPETESGKARLVRDAELFDSRLSKIDGAGSLGKDMIDIARSKALLADPEHANGRSSTEKSRASVDGANT